MLRGPCLDAPDVLHHVMAQGLERQRIFRDESDRADFVRELAVVAEAGALSVSAWALLPNHFHLLARTGQWPPRGRGPGATSPPPTAREHPSEGAGCVNDRSWGETG